MNKRELTIDWQGIAIDIEYSPDYSQRFRETYGWAIAHLSIHRKGEGQLPITTTGYKSHFTAAANIEHYGGPASFVRAWLDEASKSEKWQAYFKEERQLRLF